MLARCSISSRLLAVAHAQRDKYAEASALRKIGASRFTQRRAADAAEAWLASRAIFESPGNAMETTALDARLAALDA